MNYNSNGLVGVEDIFAGVRCKLQLQVQNSHKYRIIVCLLLNLRNDLIRMLAGENASEFRRATADVMVSNHQPLILHSS